MLSGCMVQARDNAPGKDRSGFARDVEATSEAKVLWQAGAFEVAFHRAPTLFHAGNKDRNALVRIEALTDELAAAIEGLSLWAQQALHMALHEVYMDQAGSGSHCGSIVAPPSDPRDLSELSAPIARSAQRAAVIMSYGKVEGQTNWQGVALVKEARRAWTVLRGPLPEHELNEGHPFEGFLGALFGAFELRRSPWAAYRAWARVEKQSQWDSDAP